MSFKNIYGMRMSAENSFILDYGSFSKHSDSLSDVLGVGFNLATPCCAIYIHIILLTLAVIPNPYGIMP